MEHEESKCYYAHLVHVELVNLGERVDELEKEVKEFKYPWWKKLIIKICHL